MEPNQTRMSLSSSPPVLETVHEEDFGVDDLDASDLIPRARLSRSIQRSVRKFGRMVKSYRSSYSGSYQSKFEWKDPGCGLVNFFTIKVLFFDIFVAFGDVISDFAQAFSLIFSNEDPCHAFFGKLTLAFIWLPGIVAAIHLLSMYRTAYSWKKILIWAILLIIFYPVVPLCAYISLLWNRPKDLRAHRMPKQFREAEFRAIIAHSISGGVESPLQFLLQMYLIINGKIPIPWFEVGRLSLTDWYGNELNLPTTAAISLFFSMLSMLKAVIEFNIIRIHVQEITNGHRILTYLEIIFRHLPFLATAMIFRMTTIVLLFTYINMHAFIPIGFFVLFLLLHGYRSFNLEKIPLWLITFIAIVMPICFTIDDVSGRKRPLMVALQYKTFRMQCFFSLLVFIPSIAVIVYLINFDKSWAYDPNVIFSNTEFNVAMGVNIFMGILAFGLSTRPNWTHCFFRPAECLSEQEKEEELNLSARIFTITQAEVSAAVREFDSFQVRRISRTELKQSGLKILAGLLITMLFIAPALIPLVNIFKPKDVFVAYMNENRTRIIKGLALGDSSFEMIQGCAYNVEIGKIGQMNNNHQCSMSPSNKKIFVFAREDWQTCHSLHCHEAADAIILIDGFPFHDNRNNFRPSYPTTDIKLISKPMVMVQAKDVNGTLPAGGKCNCHVLVANSRDSLPKIKFKCNSGPGHFLPYDNGTLIDQDTKNIRGQQFRTIECFWSGKPCFSYKNQMENQSFCDDPRVENFFKNPYYHQWLYDHAIEISESTELIARTRANQEDLNKCLEKARNCNGQRLWSKWTRCDDLNPFNLIMKRFCEVSSDCILMKKKSHMSERECSDMEQRSPD